MELFTRDGAKALAEAATEFQRLLKERVRVLFELRESDPYEVRLTGAHELAAAAHAFAEAQLNHIGNAYPFWDVYDESQTSDDEYFESLGLAQPESDNDSN